MRNGYPAGFVHLPRGVEVEWVKQLAAEQLVTVKTRRGFTRLEWQKLRERNEALDCRVYARAAAWIAGLDRWPERRWRDLESQLGVEATQCPVRGAGPARSGFIGRSGQPVTSDERIRRPRLRMAPSAPADLAEPALTRRSR